MAVIDPREQKTEPDPRTCDHDWRIPDGWQSGYCRKCRVSSTQR